MARSSTSQVFTDERGDYCLIELTQGQHALVDASDFVWLSQWKWYAHKDTSRQCHYRAVRKSPRDENYKQQDIFMSRVIMGEPNGVQIDHEDHNPLNNRRYNLRPSTATQNMCNRRKAHGKSSRFKGVAWHEKRGSRAAAWVARITVNKKQIHLGYRDTEEAAAELYRIAAIKYHGEFACVDMVA